jgi:menaquinone-9 beta-reductase
MRDIRVLRDCLLNSPNWEKAGHTYADAHDHYYRAIHEASDLFAAMFYESGPEADRRRARALPKIAEDPTHALDHLFSGPDLLLNESVKRRFFGED